MPSTTPPPAPDPPQETLERARRGHARGRHARGDRGDRTATRRAAPRRRAAETARGERRRGRDRRGLAGVVAVRGGPVDRVDTVRSADRRARAPRGPTRPPAPRRPRRSPRTTRRSDRGARRDGLAPSASARRTRTGSGSPTAPARRDRPVETTITRATTDGSVGALAEIGGVLLMATGASAVSCGWSRRTGWWPPSDPTRYRLKRIDAGSGEVLQSSPLAVATPVGIGSERGAAGAPGQRRGRPPGHRGGRGCRRRPPSCPRRTSLRASCLPSRCSRSTGCAGSSPQAGRCRCDATATRPRWAPSLVLQAPLVAASSWSPGRSRPCCPRSTAASR